MAPILSVVNGFSCVFGSIGNLALIAIILFHKQLHGTSEILLSSLAFADFVSCGIYLPLLMVRLNASEKLPTAMNQSRRAIGQAAAVCGSLNLLMLTIDRLIFFYRPLRYAYWMRKKVIVMIIILIYGISSLVGFYAYFDMIKSQYPKLSLIGVPLLVFFILHYAIFRLAAAHQSRVTNQEQSLQHNYQVNGSAMAQAKRNVRTVMLFGVLYLLTWLPVTIFQLSRSITNYHDPQSFQKYFYLLLTIQQISACIDPYLCCYRNNKVKSVLRKLMTVRRYSSSRKVGEPGISPANTTSVSLSDGLDLNAGNGRNKGTGDPAVVSNSLESILEDKGSQRSSDRKNSNETLDVIISLPSSLKRFSPKEYGSFGNFNNIEQLDGNSFESVVSLSSWQRATPNEYESFGNIYKMRSYGVDASWLQSQEEFSGKQEKLSTFESFENVDKVSTKENGEQTDALRNLDTVETMSGSENAENINAKEHFDNYDVPSRLENLSELSADVISEQSSEKADCETSQR